MRGCWEGFAGTGVAAVPVAGVVTEVSAITRELPSEEEEEAGDARVAAVEPVDSEVEEAEDEDEDNRTNVIRQYFQ
ncbi:hypothetical protein NDU88_002489 [Pleurodeles waltl]|uniref:Uncharacterized protein n=1 Tax=Pleurodeles waltl TaxID=8319 RepID=A0AAV7TKS3_PLEWA|nr:hypothetical protein NDU88_002489 [Pleurodeles waltl]